MMLVFICTFLGGIALFLYGMQLMGNGLQQAAGDKLQKILAALTGVLAMGVVVGAVVTALLQSSSATTVMTVGLVNAGLLTLKQAFGIVMGANIGTTITAQLIAFKLTDYVTVLLFIGFIMMVTAKRKRQHFIGQVLLGFGLLMLGMNLMSQAAMPLRDYPGFVHFISRFAHQPLLAVGVGMMMTVCVQSSAATIGILMAMASQGLLPLEGAIPVLLGDNIGTCVTAVLAAFHTSPTAKRVALSHVLFNLFGCIIFIIFLPYFTQLVLAVSPAGDLPRQLANAHTAFNVLNTCIFLPLAGPFIKLVEYLLPDKGEVVSRRPIYLDDKMLHAPGVALGLASKEVVRMGEMAVKDVEESLAALGDFDAKEVQYVKEHEPVIDQLERDITVYLTKISETELSDELSSLHTGLLHACIDLERIGDHGETLAKRARSIYEDQVHFSPEARTELKHLGDLTLAAASMSVQALAANDKKLAQQAWDKCREVKQYQKLMRKSHIVRLNNGTCSAPAGFVLMELIINMKRISDHSKNISQLVLGIF